MAPAGSHHLGSYASEPAAYAARVIGFYRRHLPGVAAPKLAAMSAAVSAVCARDDEVVESALSRTASPALIAEYQTQLPDKALLQAKQHEFYLENQADVDES